MACHAVQKRGFGCSAVQGTCYVLFFLARIVLHVHLGMFEEGCSSSDCDACMHRLRGLFRCTSVL